MNWKKRYEQKWSEEKQQRVDKEDDYSLIAELPSAKPPPTRWFEIKAHFHYNGSGPSAFGGAECWPVVTLEVPFPAGEIKQRDQFVDALQAFLDTQFNPRLKDQPLMAKLRERDSHDSSKMG